jgi:hypothetical protein
VAWNLMFVNVWVFWMVVVPLGHTYTGVRCLLILGPWRPAFEVAVLAICLDSMLMPQHHSE